MRATLTSEKCHQRVDDSASTQEPKTRLQNCDIYVDLKYDRLHAKVFFYYFPFLHAGPRDRPRRPRASQNLLPRCHFFKQRPSSTPKCSKRTHDVRAQKACDASQRIMDRRKAEHVKNQRRLTFSVMRCGTTLYAGGPGNQISPKYGQIPMYKNDKCR